MSFWNQTGTFKSRAEYGKFVKLTLWYIYSGSPKLPSGFRIVVSGTFWEHGSGTPQPVSLKHTEGNVMPPKAGSLHNATLCIHIPAVVQTSSPFHILPGHRAPGPAE